MVVEASSNGELNCKPGRVYRAEHTGIQYTGRIQAQATNGQGESDKNGADDGRQHHNLVIKTPSTHSSAQPEHSLQE